MQLSIDTADKNEVGESGGNKTNLSNLSISKKSTKAGYLIFNDRKKGSGNIKKDVKAAKDSNYLILDAKKAFNLLRYAFIQALIFQHFDPKRNMQIETDVLGYAIGEILSQLTLNNLGQ